MGSNVVLCARDTVQHTVKLSSVSKREERLIFFLNDLFFLTGQFFISFFLSFSPSRLLLLLFFLCLVDRVEREREREIYNHQGPLVALFFFLSFFSFVPQKKKKKFSFYFLPLISHLFIFFLPLLLFGGERERKGPRVSLVPSLTQTERARARYSLSKGRRKGTKKRRRERRGGARESDSLSEAAGHGRQAAHRLSRLEIPTDSGRCVWSLLL